MITFDQALASVRRASNPRVTVPKHGSWTLDDLDDGGLQLILTVDAVALCDNMQSDVPALPFFALCLAWWIEFIEQRKTRARVILIGDVPYLERGPEGDPTSRALHWNRTAILLDVLARGLPERFSLDTTLPSPIWPAKPVLNKASARKHTATPRDSLSERALERQIADSQNLREAFPSPLAILRWQLPVGVFDGKVGIPTAWTPGQGSQVDLWGISNDGKTLHLLELKKPGNKKVGMLPEALYYASVLRRVRDGLIDGNGPEIKQIRDTKRIVMWLVADSHHPLLYHSTGRSPLEWINDALKPQDTELRLLPIEVANGRCQRWQIEKMWPPHASDAQ